MLALTYLIASLSAVTSVLAAPAANATEFGSLLARAGTPSSTGNHNGYYYSVSPTLPARQKRLLMCTQFWTDNGGTVNYQNSALSHHIFTLSND